jgi:hypothetical protein
MEPGAAMNLNESMVERVAAALSVKDRGQDLWSDITEGHASHADDGNHKDDYRDLARAAIKELREPTDAMIVRAYKDDSFVPNLSPTGTWQAMIDEALR